MIVFRYLFLLLLMQSTITNTHAITEETARTTAAGSGVMLGALAGLATCYGLKKCNYTTMQSITVSAIVGLALCGVSSSLIYKDLHSSTPEAKFDATHIMIQKAVEMCKELDSTTSFDNKNSTIYKANTLIDEAEKVIKAITDEDPSWTNKCQSLTELCSTLSKNLAQRKAQIYCVQAQKLYEEIANYQPLTHNFTHTNTLNNWAITNFKGNWPLVEARKDLIDLKKSITNVMNRAKDAIEIIQSSCNQNPENTQFYDKLILASLELIEKTKQLDAIRESRIISITQNNNYQQQVNLHEKYLADQRELERLKEIRQEAERKHQREIEKQNNEARLRREKTEKKLQYEHDLKQQAIKEEADRRREYARAEEARKQKEHERKLEKIKIYQQTQNPVQIAPALNSEVIPYNPDVPQQLYPNVYQSEPVIPYNPMYAPSAPPLF